MSSQMTTPKRLKLNFYLTSGSKTFTLQSGTTKSPCISNFHTAKLRPSLGPESLTGWVAYKDEFAIIEIQTQA